MAKYYTLAKGSNGTQPSGAPIWSHEISICFESVSRPIAFAEDLGHGGSGSTFTVEEALSDLWREHFIISEGEWLIPIITKIHEGKVVDKKAIIDNYKAKNGTEPYSFEAAGT
ncbi:hypothetical protein [Paraferrimonas sp. SM1919]|uniref:hypothetical protein n=1 Tax=Paraferrimonas sp. SM1919 TaxID=2662263 RepID=UPI0013D663F0|nr:hypothetical protein [Paraferrimonas sp. SM1919]